MSSYSLLKSVILNKKNLKYYENLILFLITLLILACSKEEPNQKIPTVKIDSISLMELVNVDISASFQDINEVDIQEFGFCWSNLPNPTINDNKIIIQNPNPFSTIIKQLPSKSIIYLKAYIKSNNKLIYSDERRIETKDIQIVWEKEYNNGKSSRIIQVIPIENNCFLILTQIYKVYGNVASWTGLTKIDNAGNVIWDKEFNSGEWKEPNSIYSINNDFYIITEDWNNGSAINILRINSNGEEISEASNFKRKADQRFINLAYLDNNKIILSTFSYNSFDINGNKLNCEINKFTLNLSLEITNEEKLDSFKENGLSTSLYLVKSINSINDNWFSAGWIVNKDNSFITQYDLMLQKYDVYNQLIWQKQYIQSNDDLTTDMLILDNKNIAILAETGSKGKTSKSAWIIEIDSNNGIIISDFTYSNLKFGPSGVVNPNAFQKNSQNQYYIIGAVAPSTVVTSNAFISKTDDKGQLLWEHTFINEGSTKYSSFDSVIINKNKEIFVFGKKLNQLSDKTTTIIIKKISEN